MLLQCHSERVRCQVAQSSLKGLTAIYARNHKLRKKECPSPLKTDGYRVIHYCSYGSMGASDVQLMEGEKNSQTLFTDGSA